jgi:single-stranded DNA-binding protein
MGTKGEKNAPRVTHRAAHPRDSAVSAAMPKRKPPRRENRYDLLDRHQTFFKKDGDRQERTEWHRVQVWGRMADYAAPFKKGSHICVEGCAASKQSSGAWRSREYESQGAKVRTWPYLIGNRYDIVANSIINLSKGQRNAQTDPAEAAA